MRILGIDLGTKSMGLAITDTSQTIINALENFEFAKNNYELCFERLRKLVDTYKNEIGTIVLGWPLKLSGEKSDWTITVENFGKKLVKLFPTIKIMLQDERMTTKNATESLKYSMGLKCSKIKKIKDKMSAYLILEEYLSASNKHRKE